MANQVYARVCVARLLGDFAFPALFVRFGVGLRASARTTGKNKKINKINARARMGHPAPPCICMWSRQQFCFFGVTGIRKNVHLKGTPLPYWATFADGGVYPGGSYTQCTVEITICQEKKLTTPKIALILVIL